MNSILLSFGDIREIVQFKGPDRFMDEVIAELTAAFAKVDRGAYTVPARSGFDYDLPQTGLLEWMPAMEKGDKVTLKVVGYHPLNPQRQQLPTILSVALSFDTRTGHLIGLTDGTFSTAVRTGAASAIASRVLASPDSRVLGLIGAGSQAVTQLHALSREFRLEEVLVYDIDAEANASFAGRVAPLELGDLQIRNAPLAEVVRDADIICTATSVGIGAGPVLDDIELKPWVHINAVGSDFHGKTELPLTLLKRALACPDFAAQALLEGECQQLHPETLGPDLVTLLREPGSFDEYRDKTTVFDSTGWAVEDHVITEILIKSAKALGIGTPVQIEGVCDDPKNPYGFLQETTRCLRDGQDVSRAVNTL